MKDVKFWETCQKEADMVLLASAQFASDEPCRDCDLEVGHVCPLCALTYSARYLANNIKCGNLVPKEE